MRPFPSTEAGRRARGTLLLLLLMALGACRAPYGAARPVAEAREGQRPLREALAFADSALEAAVRAGTIPGAVLRVAHDGRVLHEEAYGVSKRYAYGMRPQSPPAPMTVEHVFDLASVTKVMATTWAVMLLADRGQLDVDAPVHAYLPDFRGPDKDRVRVSDLLAHTSGLHRWKPVYHHATTADEAWAYIRDLPLEFAVGAGRHYSDLGFMALGRIVERVAERPLDVFLQEELYGPLGLARTAFNPRSGGAGPFAATSHGNPYERRMVEDDHFGYRIDDASPAFTGWRAYTLEGEVNDGNAFHAWGGVAGHAGLFSTARELAVLLEVLLRGGTYRGRRIVGAAVVERFLAPVPGTGHGLGWSLPRVDVGSAGSVRTFSHGGFTGTFVLGAPDLGVSLVLLTNRQNLGVDEETRYPDVERLRRPIVRRILEAAAAEAGPRSRCRPPPGGEPGPPRRAGDPGRVAG